MGCMMKMNCNQRYRGSVALLPRKQVSTEKQFNGSGLRAYCLYGGKFYRLVARPLASFLLRQRQTHWYILPILLSFKQCT